MGLVLAERPRLDLRDHLVSAIDVKTVVDNGDALCRIAGHGTQLFRSLGIDQQLVRQTKEDIPHGPLRTPLSATPAVCPEQHGYATKPGDGSTDPGRNEVWIAKIDDGIIVAC